ncbi:glycosyltransferase family 2 protein [Myxococcota bacterium]|nr:glycosyltransferase family 2 protein [Myxococcota bacterium]
MWRTRKIALVIPAWEAEGTLAAVLAAVPDFVDRVFVIDDGSAIPVQAPPDPRIQVIRHPRNLGVGAAIGTGYRAARAAGIDVGVVWGADGQMDPGDLPALLDALEEGPADYVKGDRFSHPDCPSEMPWIRRIGGYGLTFLTRLATGIGDLRDAQCGYTALRLEVLDRIPLDWAYPRYGFPNDLLAMLAGAGCRVSQVTVRPVYRGAPSGLQPALALFVHPWILARAGLIRCLGGLAMVPRRPGILRPAVPARSAR